MPPRGPEYDALLRGQHSEVRRVAGASARTMHSVRWLALINCRANTNRRSSNTAAVLEPKMPSHSASKRVVVSFPIIEDETAWQEIVSIRNRFDPLAARVPAHLTLAFPFEDPMSDADLKHRLRSAIIDASSFSI